MTMVTIAGRAVQLDADGCLVDPLEWTPDIAEALARKAGVTLTDRHWRVIEFCRRDAAEQGTPPGLERIIAVAGIPRDEMYRLFPTGPGLLAVRISGLTSPTRGA
jgi:tRNA 2-thiouridine synthesizing protein E